MSPVIKGTVRTPKYCWTTSVSQLAEVRVKDEKDCRSNRSEPPTRSKQPTKTRPRKRGPVVPASRVRPWRRRSIAREELTIVGCRVEVINFRPNVTVAYAGAVPTDPFLPSLSSHRHNLCSLQFVKPFGSGFSYSLIGRGSEVPKAATTAVLAEQEPQYIDRLPRGRATARSQHC